jgi:CHASE2 domain-containing sensor protein
MRSLLSKRAVLVAFLASIAVCALVIGVRQFEALEELELNSYDQMVQMGSDEGPDPRLLIVAVTEADIQALGKWPTSDQTLNRLLEKLEQYQPRVIGLDIYRDLSVDPGHTELATRLQVNDNIIAVCKVASSGDPGVAPPPTVPKSRLGFSDIVVDPRGVVRRNLLFTTPKPNSPCSTNHSFSLQLALHYLEKEGIQPKLTSKDYLQLGSTIFKPLKQEDIGAYQNIDTGGYQIQLNYRSSSEVAQQVTLTQVLSGEIEPSWVQDRIVLIGVTAESIKDYFYTPYSKGREGNLTMAGVSIHAHQVSQILSAVLDNRPLIWFWPGWVEVLWVWAWSLVGGGLALCIRHPLYLGLAEGTALGTLTGISYVVFTQGGWIPLVPPALASLAMVATVISYRAYVPPKPPDNDETDSSLLARRYRIIEPLGSGGFGQTYLAKDTQRPGNPLCVVKQLKPNCSDEKFLQIARRLFNTEAETLQTVGRNDQIPQLLAFFEQNKEFYLVQDFIKGHTLSEELPLGKRLLESQVVALLKDVLGIINFIHSYGVIHRDIKPSNIMRRESDGRLVLIDFGAVKELHTQLASPQESYTIAIGTAGFAPTEQLMGQPVFSSDIYALGIIGLQAVTGIAPTQLQKNARKEFIWRDYAQVSDRLAAILDKMVRYHPSERYQSAAEVLQALQHL